VFITNVNEYPFEIIEFVMLFTKYYIHCCKWSNNLPTIEVLNAKFCILIVYWKMCGYSKCTRYYHENYM
jgi:hypothetical protein